MAVDISMTQPMNSIVIDHRYNFFQVTERGYIKVIDRYNLMIAGITGSNVRVIQRLFLFKDEYDLIKIR
jgi:hypothetical protein